MKIENLVYYDTQLINVNTTKITAEKKNERVDRSMNISGETKGSLIDTTKGKSVIRLKIYNDDFELSLTTEGIFEFKNEIVDEQKAIQFMEVQGIRILWSYVRENVFQSPQKCYKIQL